MPGEIVKICPRPAEFSLRFFKSDRLLGLGACPIGGFDAEALAAALAVPAGEAPALVIALGHCSHPALERLRKPLD